MQYIFILMHQFPSPNATRFASSFRTVLDKGQTHIYHSYYDILWVFIICPSFYILIMVLVTKLFSVQGDIYFPEVKVAFWIILLCWTKNEREWLWNTQSSVRISLLMHSFSQLRYYIIYYIDIFQHSLNILFQRLLEQ